MENITLLLGIDEVLRYRLGSFPEFAVAAVIGTAAFAWFAPALQRWFPRLWPKDSERRQSLLTDLLYFILGPLTVVIGTSLTSVGIALAAIAIGRRPDMSVFQGFGPVIHQPYWLMFLECYILSDAIAYFTHRAAHSVPVLWRLHATHHSVEHMRGIAYVRFHPLETWELVPNLALLFMLGFPVDVLAPITPIAQLFAFYIHTGSRFAPGPFRYVFAFPGFHRWHHAKYIVGNGWNFGTMFPVWDWLFGTYYFPKHECDEFGLVDANMPKTFARQLVYPFRRGRKQPNSALAADETSVAQRTAEQS